MTKKHTFTLKQQKFIEFYEGNGTEAAKKAGYSEKTAEVQAVRLLRNARIKDAIAKRTDKALKKGIMDREQRQAFWTSITNDQKQKLSDRLKASELLGKSECDFSEKIVNSGEITLKMPVINVTVKADK